MADGESEQHCCDDGEMEEFRARAAQMFSGAMSLQPASTNYPATSSSLDVVPVVPPQKPVVMKPTVAAWPAPAVRAQTTASHGGDPTTTAVGSTVSTTQAKTSEDFRTKAAALGLQAISISPTIPFDITERLALLEREVVSLRGQLHEALDEKAEAVERIGELTTERDQLKAVVERLEEKKGIESGKTLQQVLGTRDDLFITSVEVRPVWGNPNVREYCIKVHYSNQNWEVSRRFSQCKVFEKLLWEPLRLGPLDAPPALPETTFRLHETDVAMCKGRADAIFKFLRHVCAHSNPVVHTQLLDFLFLTTHGNV